MTALHPGPAGTPVTARAAPLSGASAADYRPDIDGLRAVAILPVMLFHAGLGSFHGVPLAPGGFVGVDVFFVISGFLISGHVYRDIDRRSYSATRFYANRIRRLFPALSVVYLVCLAYMSARGIWIEAEETRDATIASLFFVSNIFFSMHAGYFDAAIQSSPLLHTWSLSIEEQFYIALPLVLLAVHRLAHGARCVALLVLVIGSLGASAYLCRALPDAAYYSLAARAWELGIGGLLAISGLRPRSRAAAEALGIGGLLAIASATVAFDRNTAFPGFAALLPTLGAAAVILSGSSAPTATSRLLSVGPLRRVGLMSYSLYLWHWPLLVFSRLEGFSTRASAVVVIALCCPVAWLSWRYVERPFRTTRNRSSARITVAAGAVAMASLAALSLASPVVNGILQPTTDQARRFAAFDPRPTEAGMRAGTCFLTSTFNSLSDYRPETCLKRDQSEPNVLVIGDSHAAQYVEALRRTNPRANIMQATASGCLPLLGTTGERRCLDLWDWVTQRYLPDVSLDAIVLAGRWTPGTAVRAFETATHLLHHARTVVVIGPNQEFSAIMPRLLVKASIAGDLRRVDRYTSPEPPETDRAFSAAAPKDPRIVYLSFFRTMCASRCPVVSSAGEPLDADDNHLSLSAAIDMVRRNQPALSFRGR